MSLKFKGTDRRALQSIMQAFEYIKKRDNKARDPKPTAAISTRDTVIDDNSQVVQEGFAVVEQWLIDCLDCPDDADLPTTTLELGKKHALIAGAYHLMQYLRPDQMRAGVSVLKMEPDALTTVYEFTSTDPTLAASPLRLVYSWNRVAVLRESFLTVSDATWGVATSDLWFDRTIV